MENWIDNFGDTPIPVLGHTIGRLSKLCSKDVPIHELVELVETDPGLTVQLIRASSTSSHSSLRAEVTSVQQALMMLGTERLKKLPATLPTVEKTLNGSAQQHLLKIFSVANHAARQSTVWAKLRRDMIPDEVTAATLLHFIGEMVMSIYAPDQIDKIQTMCKDKSIASEEAQYIILGFTLDQLSLEIADRWHLPPLVSETLHAENASHPRAYSIMLAVQLARHAALNWYSPKMNKFYEEASEWLDKPTSILIKETHQLAVSVAHDTEFYNVAPAAALLIATYSELELQEIERLSSENANGHTGICLIPQLEVMKTIIIKLKNISVKTKNLHEIIDLAMHGLHDGAGLNRVVFAIYDKPQNRLKAYSIIGADNDPAFGQFQISLDQKNLFSFMSDKIQAVWLNDTNREKYSPLLPEKLTNLIMTDSFYSMSVVINNSLYGLFYADRHTTDCQLDKNTYNYFKSICMQTIQTIQRMTALQQ